MSNDKFPKVKIMTPRGRAIFPKLDKPDTKWKAEGQYSVKLSLPPESVEKYREPIAAMLAKYVEETREKLKSGDGKAKAKAKTLTVNDAFFSDEVDDDGENTGNIIVNFKMTASGVSKKDGKPWSRKPAVFDAKGKSLKVCPPVWGGSVLIVAGEAVPYYTPKDNLCGVTLRLEGVQIIELRSGSNRDAADFGFHEEEGFAATEEGEGGFSDETAGEGAAPSADGDF